MNYWLIKSEPDAFSIDDLQEAGTEPWDGIRNYQARNFMRDAMQIGDLALFYHSNTKPPGVVGVAKVSSKPYPDFTAWDESSKYYDPKSTEDNPRWILVDFQYICHLETPVNLAQLKELAESDLEGMLILRRGNRLSITPVEQLHFEHICRLGGIDPKAL